MNEIGLFQLSKFDLTFMSAYACGTLLTAFMIFRGVRKVLHINIKPTLEIYLLRLKKLTRLSKCMQIELND